MTTRQWYAAIDGKQAGPFTDERLRELIAAGSVRPETLLWCEGMRDWTQAGDVPGLFPQSGSPPPFAAGAGSAAGAATGPLSTKAPVWPLFGRGLLLLVGLLLVVPAPWTTTGFIRWLVDQIDVPGQQRVRFAGKAGDIWYIFILYALCTYLAAVGSLITRYAEAPGGALLNWLVVFVTPILTLSILRWVFANLVWEGQTAPLQFTGGYWAMLGWSLLTGLAAITVIGWAWVCTAWGRWMCRRVIGANRQLVFNASGWGLLWRTVVITLVNILIIPIPWTTRWYLHWVVSQFALV
jgi:hypothetical protein